MKYVQLILKKKRLTYLQLSNCCSDIGDGAMKDFDRKVVPFFPIPSLPLIWDFPRILWRRSFEIISLQIKKEMK